jgi:S-(hydroxymethyl)glutathione dehydrogenase/alcohol dehydrogenase
MMKAAVCYEFGKPLVIEDVNLEPPRKGQVKVRLAATAVCHSDIHALRGDLRGVLPIVAGHESAGYIAEVGDGVTSVKVGDPVVVSLISSCGECLYCRSGFPHLCETEMPLTKNSPLTNQKGERLTNLFRTATLAEYSIVDKSQVVKIPPEMPMDRAALLGCGVITGFGSVVNRAQVKALESVVVIGIGGVGLNSVQGAAFSGAYPVIAVDVLDSKLKAALDFGATHTVNAKEVDPVEAVKKLTSGRGTDYAFITVGSCAAIVQGLHMCGRRGTVVNIGLPSMQDSLTLSPFEFIGMEKVMTGSFMGSTNLPVHIPELITLYQAKKLKLDELITKRYSLDRVNEAIEAVEKGEALRNVIIFE